MKRKQKVFSPIVAIIAAGAIVVILVVVLLLVQKVGQPTLERTGTQQTTQGVPAIQNTNDFNNVASQLDNTDLNELDRGLDQLDADTSTF